MLPICQQSTAPYPCLTTQYQFSVTVPPPLRLTCIPWCTPQILKSVFVTINLMADLTARRPFTGMNVQLQQVSADVMDACSETHRQAGDEVHDDASVSKISKQPS